MSDYNMSSVDGVTGQKRITQLMHLASVWIEGEAVAPDEVITSDWYDCSADIEKTLFIKTVNSFTVSVQFTDDPAANPDGFDYCDGDGNPITFTATFNPGRAIPVSCKGIRMRVLMRNKGTTQDTPYCGVD